MSNDLIDEKAGTRDGNGYEEAAASYSTFAPESIIHEGHDIGSDREPARTPDAPLVDPDMPAQELRLHMGEMTAQEERTARAAIRLANSAFTMKERP